MTENWLIAEHCEQMTGTFEKVHKMHFGIDQVNLSVKVLISNDGTTVPCQLLCGFFTVKL